MSDRHGIGGNEPPAFEAYMMALDDAYSTAQDFLDGSALENDGQADAVGKILSEVKKIKKDANAERIEEKRPHDDAGKAVQAKWKPLLERADTILAAAQKPLTAYLNQKAAKQAEEARKAREEAERKAQKAIAAERQAESMDDLEKARAAQEEADQAARDAKRASKAKAHVAGVDRAVGLRTYKVVTVTDHRKALLWIAARDKSALDAFIDDYARRNAPTRPMDGVEVTEEKRVA